MDGLIALALAKKYTDEHTSGGGAIITANSNTTIYGYSIPQLSIDQIITAYNAVVAGKPCMIVSADAKSHFVIDQADTVGSDISICFPYYNIMLLCYMVENDTVVITASPIGNYPVATDGLHWNTEYRAGSTNGTKVLPTPITDGTAQELRYIFSSSDGTISFTAPASYILGNEDGFIGLSAGNTLTYTNLTTGSIYECSFSVLDSTHIGLIMKEWKTA